MNSGTLRWSSTLGDRVFLLASIVAGVGVGFRIQSYSQGRSLWLDEARLALNIAAKSAFELIKPLEHDQSAPLLMLWAFKASIHTFGVSEQALRLVPLLCGCAAVTLYYPLCRRFLDGKPALLATAFGALAPTLIYYSNEVKQYSGDLLVAVVLLLLAADWVPQARAAVSRKLFAAGIVAVWVSSAAPFVLAGTGLAVLVAPHRPLRARVQIVGLLASGWLVSFGLAYALVFRAAVNSAYLQHFWSHAFLQPWRPDFLADTWLAMRDTLWGSFFGYAVGGRLPAAATYLVGAGTVMLAMLLGVGVGAFLRRRPLWMIALLGGPFIAAGGASLLSKYPVGLRLMLFVAPSLHILVAAACEILANRGSRFSSHIRWVAIGGLGLLIPVSLSLRDLFDLFPRQHLRPLVHAYLMDDSKYPIYVFAGSIPAWAYYTTDWSDPDKARLALFAKVAGSEGPAFQNAPPRMARVDRAPEYLTASFEGRTELLGLASGVEAFGNLGPLKQMLDEGWVQVEADRIMEAGGPFVWILMSHYYGPEKLLVGCLLLRGVRIVTAITGRNALLLLVRVPPDGERGPAASVKSARIACASRGLINSDTTAVIGHGDF